MQSKIDGTVMQMLTVYLNRGDAVYTESGGMAMDDERHRNDDKHQRWLDERLRSQSGW